VIPSREWINELMRQKAVPENIIRHSYTVRAAAVILSQALISAGYRMDMGLVDRAALLHDICKADSLREGGDHALMGRDLIKGYGYEKIGDIIGQHIWLRSMNIDEAMVVNYADKRVMHDRVVSLEKRFLDLMVRYGKNERSMERILGHFAHASVIEQSIFQACGQDLCRLENLNLIPGDHSLYGGDSLL